MKGIFIILIFVELFKANVDMVKLMDITIEQNIKALYRDINLTQEQKKYIIDNEEKNINVIYELLKKGALNTIGKIKNADNSTNVVQFELYTDGTVHNIEIIYDSSYKELDKITKTIIENLNNQLILPKDKITLRYIFKYKTKNQNAKMIYSNNNNNSNFTYINNIQKGTTHFKYNSQEYIREFTTNEDGFINVSQEPNSCAKRITILTEKGQSFAEATGYLFSRINKEAPKGKYKILIQTKQDCNINLQYQ